MTVGWTECEAITDYIDYVESGEYAVCKRQLQMVSLVKDILNNEDLVIDYPQLEQYLSYQKYFPFRLFPWETFCFALHNCLYRADGQLRFPRLDICVGRGAGKNGFEGFEDFCLLTKTNGVQKYDIYLFAMGEEQAKQSWNDVYDVLEAHKDKMSKHFRWTKEVIVCKDTNSSYYFCTSSPKTKDGQRPGKVGFDEIHAYTDYKLITVGKTGLGKKDFPRETNITTDGDVRGGVIDDMKNVWEQILNREIPDNGILVFWCQLDSEKEVHNIEDWYKANPSLYKLPTLLERLKVEYNDYVANPAANTAFISKRMNLPPTETENAVTSWDNIMATNQPIDEEAINGMPCTAGIDYMKTTDFLGVAITYRVGDMDYVLKHCWVNRQSKDLERIKAPLEEWATRGLLTFVDTAEIPPELPVCWIVNEASKRNSRILMFGVDDYRYALIKEALLVYGFSADKPYNNVKLIRPSDQMRNIPLITSKFVNHRYAFGDDPCLRWQINNAKTVVSPAGNITYGKIEPKSRKTDEWMAVVASQCCSEVLNQYKDGVNYMPKGVYEY